MTFIMYDANAKCSKEVSTSTLVCSRMSGLLPGLDNAYNFNSSGHVQNET